METQKILNLLNGSDNECAKFATRKWYVTDSESKSNQSNKNSIKFLRSSLESSLCDHSDPYILVIENITVKRRNAANTDDIELGAITQKQYLKIVHHLEIAEQKLMTLLLIMQIY